MNVASAEVHLRSMKGRACCTVFWQSSITSELRAATTDLALDMGVNSRANRKYITVYYDVTRIHL